jgi:hypothetical protein
MLWTTQILDTGTKQFKLHNILFDPGSRSSGFGQGIPEVNEKREPRTGY